MPRTQPVLDILLLYRAGSAVCHDLEERGHLSPAEAISKLGQRVLGISLLGSSQTAHSRLGELLDGDQIVREVFDRLGPDSFIERVWIGKVGVRATRWQRSVLERMENTRGYAYLMEMSCSRMLWRPRSARSKVRVTGYLGLVLIAWVKRMMASPCSILKPANMPSASFLRSMFFPSRGM